MLKVFAARKGSCAGNNMEPENGTSMRTLLRHVPTGLWVKAAEQWTSNPDEALDFKAMSQAIRFVERAGLRKMELAFISPHLCRCTEVPLDLLSWGTSISNPCAQVA
jgi:hypothetical protein